MSPVLIEPALPPLPTIWKRPFQPAAGKNTANLMLPRIVPRTSQCAGAALLPLVTSGTAVADVMATSGALKPVASSAHGMAAATMAGNSAPAARPARTALRRFILSPPQTKRGQVISPDPGL